MIGAEIVALVALVLGTGIGYRALDRWVKSRAHKRRHEEQEEEAMRADLRAALAKPGAAGINEFFALWAHRLSKEDKKRLEDVRDDRIVGS